MALLEQITDVVNSWKERWRMPLTPRIATVLRREVVMSEHQIIVRKGRAILLFASFAKCPEDLWRYRAMRTPVLYPVRCCR
jgi:hypothetical protein